MRFLTDKGCYRASVFWLFVCSLTGFIAPSFGQATPPEPAKARAIKNRQPLHTALNKSGPIASLGPTKLLQPSFKDTEFSEFPKSPLLGQWKFYKMSVDGVDMPPRDQRLDLTFSFDDEGVSTLYWSYDRRASFCERKGRYFYQDGFLIDEIFWANPKNKGDCAADPDMQVGRKSTSKVDLSDDEFALHIPFSDKEILYYWKKLEEE